MKFFILLFCVSLFFNPSLFGQMDIDIDSFKLDNGMNFVLNNSAKFSGKKVIQLVLRSGSLHEDQNERGVAHIINHLLFYNLRSRYPEVWNKCNSNKKGMLSPDKNAKIQMDETIFTFEVENNDHELFNDLISIFVTWFTPEFESELDLDFVIKDVLSIDHNNNSTFNIIQKLFFEKSFEGTCYSGKHSIYDIIDFENITQQAVYSYFNRCFKVENISLLVTGYFNSEMTRNMLTNHFQGFAPDSIETKYCDQPIIPSKRVNVHQLVDDRISISTFQVNYSLADYHFILKESPGFDDFASAILNHWFRETILQNMADVNFGIIVGNVVLNREPKNLMTLTLQAFIQDKKYNEGVGFVIEKWNNLMNNGFSPDEWEFLVEHVSQLRSYKQLESNMNIDSRVYSRSMMDNYLKGRSANYHWINDDSINDLINDVKGHRFVNLLRQFKTDADLQIILAVPEKNKSALPGKDVIAKSFISG